MKLNRRLLLGFLMLIANSLPAQFAELKNTYWNSPLNYEFLWPGGWTTLPFGSVIEDGGVLYGTTSRYGLGGSGVIFSMNLDGTGYSELFVFNSGAGDGRFPLGALVSDGTSLYGTTAEGNGTLFRIEKDGTGFITLHYFSSPDGVNPNSTLILDGTTLYGTTLRGGAENLGTIFRIETDGSGFTLLYDFSSALGGVPMGDLSTDGTSLFGFTSNGGTSNEGTIFRIEKDGTGYASIHSFSNASGFRGAMSNSDGNFGKLVYDGTYFYGTNNMGGAFGVGNLFRIQPDGSGYSNLLQFNHILGRVPIGSLAFDGTSLYGTASILGMGSKDEGMVFRLNTDGTGFTKLASLAPPGTDKKAAGNLVISGSTLLGISSYGYYGSFNTEGAVFRVETDGSNFTDLHSFSGTAEGWRVKEKLTSDGTYLYAATSEGGSRNNGTVFRIKADGSNYELLLPYFPGPASPAGGLILQGGQLFGMASMNGTAGSIYRVDADGSNYTSLHEFQTTDGYGPWGGLVDVSGSLFGVTSFGGSNGTGVLFRISSDGSGFVVLYEFPVAALGNYPAGSLYYDGTFLLGYTQAGGTSNLGVLYRIMPDGSGYTKLLDFSGPNGAMTAFGNEIPSLTSDGSFLYGMTPQGGANNNGTIFKVKPDGSSYTKLHDFVAGFFNQPNGSLFLHGSTLYGMTRSQVYRLQTDGSNYTSITSGCSGVGNLFHDGTSLYGPTDYGLFRLQEIVVSSFTPSSGPVGTVVSISGENLLAGPLRFNGVLSSASGTSTNITTTVPVGATTGPITITAGCVAVSTTDFTLSSCSVTPPSPTDGYHCGPGTVVLGASGASGSQEYRWYDVAAGGSSQGTLASYTTPSQSVTKTFYASIYDPGTGCESARMPVIADIHPVPSPPGTVGATSCNPASLTLTASGGVNGEYRWYTMPTGGTALAGEVNDTYSTPVIAVSTTYYASLTNAFCESSIRTPAVATINTVAAPSIVTTNCTASSATLDGPTGFSGYLWSTGATTPQLTVTSAGTYTLVVTSSAGCTSPSSPPVSFTAAFCNQSPVAAPGTANTTVKVPVVVAIVTLLSDPDSNLDLATLVVIGTTSSGAPATINSNNELVIDYSNTPFAGTDVITLEICDQAGACVQFEITVEVAGEITIFNAISPNADGKNEVLFIENIDLLPETQHNKLTLFDRWGSVVFEAVNYNNTTNTFRGLGKNGEELPSGTYFYSLEFSGGTPKRTGFISLRK